MISAHSTKSEILDALTECLKSEGRWHRERDAYKILEEVVQEFLLWTPKSLRSPDSACAKCREEIIGHQVRSTIWRCRWHRAEWALEMLKQAKEEAL